MKLDKLFQSLLLTGAVVVFINNSARSEEVREDAKGKLSIATVGGSTATDTEKKLFISKSPPLAPSKNKPRREEPQFTSSLPRVKSNQSSNRILQLSEIEQISQSAALLVQSPTPTNPSSVPPDQGGKGGIIEVTGVQAKPTVQGVEVILQTTQGEQLQITNRSAENKFIADIPNAQLRLANGDGFTFSSQNPVEGITEITVSNLDANTIRVTVTGTASVPVVQLFDSQKEGLIFSIAGAVASTPSPQAKPEEEPESEIQPEQPSTQSDQPIELTVTGQQDGYRVPNASTATKTDTPLRDIPASIQVIPRQLLEDQNTIRIQDALENISGVNKRGNLGGSDAGGYVIRGFEQSGNFRNGFPDNDFYSSVDRANIERIEVLKGPASVLFGQVEPGGIINVVTKQPLSTPYYSVDFSAGSYAFYRPSIDVSGPLTADGSLLYRLNLAYQNAESFRDFNFTERVFIAPTLTWNISDRTSVTFDFEYLNNEYRSDRGLPAIGDRPAPVPISRFIGYPFDGDTRTDRVFRASYRLQHQFSENWQLRNAFSFTSAKLSGAFATGGRSLIDNRFSPITLTEDDFLREFYTLQTELTGRFNTGSIVHRPLFGVELRRNTSTNTIFGSDPIPRLDIFNPNYNVTLPTSFNDEPSSSFTARTNTLGIYLQDQITVADNLKLLIGGRFDTTSYKEDFFAGDFALETDISASAFSPRVGIVYQPIEPISLYASYSRSFVPETFGSDVSGNPFEPTKGTQYEAGIKADISQQLSATLAFFHITKSNIVTTDPNNPDFSIQVGEQTSRGIELDIAGEILPGWRIITSYAYTDANVSEDNTIPVGNRLINVPEHAASLWTNYEFQSGNLQGLGFGLGIYYVGSREADLDNTATLPSYWRTDSAIYYKRDNWRVAVNFRNLFNETYYETAQSRNIIYPGAPFTVIGSFSIQF
jgi:iron complex outermembrane recepter protein